MQTEAFKSAKNAFSQHNPVPELMELNMRTIKDMTFLNPKDWSDLKHPQDIFDKSLKMFVDNGHKMLDYFQHAAEIVERNMSFSSDEAMKNFREGMTKTQRNMDQMMKNTSEATSTFARKQSPSRKNSNR